VSSIVSGDLHVRPDLSARLVDDKLSVIGVAEVVILAVQQTEHTQHWLSGVVGVLGGI
jgi:hypothetical protein